MPAPEVPGLTCKSPVNITPGPEHDVIVCKKCGNQNPDGETFCLSCHSFLEWSGEKIVEAPPPPPPPPPATPEAEPAFVERMKQAVGLDKPKVEPKVEVAPNAPRVDGTPPASASPPTAGPSTYTPAPPAAATSAPPAPPPASPAQVPAAVLPQAVAPAPERPRQAPRNDVATAPRYRPGDLICGRCGAGNSPDRHFCQRCGANLAAAVVVKQPWWRRFFPARTAPAAGTRPKAAPTERAWGSALFKVIALGLVVLVVLAYVVISPLRTRVNSTVGSAYGDIHRHFFGQPAYVRAASATASSEVATHPARLSLDLIKETYWAANVNTDKQPWLRLTFGGPVDLDGILLTTGAGNDYATFARPKDVQIIFSDKTSARLTLKDDPNATRYDVSARGITYVEIHILSVYPSAQSPDVAINEVEFFKIQ